MNKTFTAALAISAISSLALADRTPATVDTPPAGYVDVSTDSFVLNPFTAFDGTLSLGDIEGTDGAILRVISEKGKSLLQVTWYSSKDPAGWWDSTPTCRNDYSIDRGKSVQFISDNDTVTMAGVLTNGTTTVDCVKGHNFIGNVAPVGKSISTFTVGGDYDPFSSSYVYVNGQKLVYLNSTQAGWIGKSAGWYLKSDIEGSSPETATAQTTTIAAGTGFRAYFTTENVTITAVGE